VTTSPSTPTVPSATSPRRILILGKQGAGKGTQSTLIAERLGIPHISTGDMLRAAVRAGTEFGLQAKRYMDAGELVPDAVMLGMVGDRLAEPDAAAGFLLDGFPRTRVQAEGLAATLGQGALDAVVELDVPTDVVVERISSRRVCAACGAVQTPESVGEGTCWSCAGRELVQRDDDTEVAVRRRLALYEEQTAPLVDYYRSQGLLATVDGDGDPSEVLDRILEAIDAEG
jgi:adenylate kinase